MPMFSVQEKLQCERFATCQLVQRMQGEGKCFEIREEPLSTGSPRWRLLVNG